MRPDPPALAASRHVTGPALVLALAAAAAGAAPPPQPRPNIIVLVADDLRWDALGYAGHPLARTPNIDRIARGGAQFRNAFATNPLCSPSRASLLTGQYSRTHGVIDNSEHTARSYRLATFPRLLRDAGYDTAHIGKWHMGNDDSPRPGFERWVAFAGQGRYENPILNVDDEQTHTAGYATDILTQQALEFVRRKRQRPFFLWLAHKAVHAPFTPAARHRDLFPDGASPALLTPPGDGGRLMRLQLRCLLALDEGVGLLLDALRDTHQLDHTLVAFTSDNGQLWGEHGLTGKQAPYEESIRVPLAIQQPGRIAPRTVVEGLALNVDLAPTLLEAASLPVPAAMQGRSLWPLLRGDEAGWRDSFLAEAFAKKRKDLPTWQAVRTRGWKYVRYVERPERDELYDLERDPRESRNLIREPAARERLAQLKRQLDQLLAAGPHS